MEPASASFFCRCRGMKSVDKFFEAALGKEPQRNRRHTYVPMAEGVQWLNGLRKRLLQLNRTEEVFLPTFGRHGEPVTLQLISTAPQNMRLETAELCSPTKRISGGEKDTNSSDGSPLSHPQSGCPACQKVSGVQHRLSRTLRMVIPACRFQSSRTAPFLLPTMLCATRLTIFTQAAPVGMTVRAPEEEISWHEKQPLLWID